MTESNKAYNRLQKQKSKCIICVSGPRSVNACSLRAHLGKAQTLETFRNLLGQNVRKNISVGILDILFIYLLIFSLKYW